MSTNAKEVKQKKLKLFSKFSTKVYNRCRLCGRKRGYMRKFDICRICFREQAHVGNIPGVTKASW